MCAAITLAKPDDLDRLEGLVMLCHQEIGIDVSPAQRRQGLSHVLANSPHAAAYLIGPVRAPVGYVMLSFGWSLQLMGHYCTIDQIYVRSGVRGRGMAYASPESGNGESERVVAVSRFVHTTRGPTLKLFSCQLATGLEFMSHRRGCPHVS